MFRQKSFIVPMTSETSNTNRRTGGVTAEFVGETQSATASTMSWDQVGLVAKAISAITIVSSELNADTIMSIGDQITVEIALAFATKEDACGFNGTGTSAFGKIKGILPRLIELNGIDDGGGLVLAAGNAWSEITLENMEKVMGQTINLASATEEWYCSKTFWAQVMVKLQKAAGGATPSDISAAGSRNFLGFTVNLSNSFPKTEANSQIPCIFGDLSLSSSFGDRMGQTLSTNTQGVVGNVNLFTSRQMAIMGVERFDINNHDLGTATEGGPVVGLITAAS
jgi:HK97 family phage major capsid protein